MNAFDDLSPRLAAVRSWFDCRDFTYAITRLRGCVNPTGATLNVLDAYSACTDRSRTHDVVTALWHLREELREEGEVV